MPFRLEPLGKGPVIHINRPVVVIGRQVDCDIRIDSTKISRKHCVIVQLEDRLIIRDLGSTNGTFKNENQITESEIIVGDQVRIGDARYTVVIPGANEPAAQFPEAGPKLDNAAPADPPKLERVAPLGPMSSSGFEVLFTKVSGPGNLENVSSVRLKGDEEKTVGKGDNCDIRITGDEKIDTVQCDLSLKGSNDVNLTNRGAANNVHLHGGNGTYFVNLVQGIEYDIQIGDTYFKLIIRQ